MLKLLFKFKDSILREIETEKTEVTIGRIASNDIPIDNVAVSAHHARILRDGRHYVVEDLNSTNGTFVNERKITRRVLKANDVITIGKHSLVMIPKKGGVKVRNLIMTDIERTWKLDTEQHRKMLKKQGKK
ncbi:MAG: FHA domain-containing protein [Candidatus Aminicenantes bacterium]|nr:MAG: FHA domain-containing protein [Candidatus Aminicenantes bacterium]